MRMQKSIALILVLLFLGCSSNNKAKENIINSIVNLPNCVPCIINTNITENSFKRTETIGADGLKEIHEYNMKGQLISNIWFDSSDIEIERYDYTFDKCGNRVASYTIKNLTDTSQWCKYEMSLNCETEKQECFYPVSNDVNYQLKYENGLLISRLGYFYGNPIPTDSADLFYKNGQLIEEIAYLYDFHTKYTYQDGLPKETIDTYISSGDTLTHKIYTYELDSLQNWTNRITENNPWKTKIENRKIFYNPKKIN